jgi:hypothetical protein
MCFTYPRDVRQRHSVHCQEVRNQRSEQMLVANPLNSAYDLDRASRGWWVLLVNGIVTVVAGGIILSTDWNLGDERLIAGARDRARATSDASAFTNSSPTTTHAHNKRRDMT